MKKKNLLLILSPGLLLLAATACNRTTPPDETTSYTLKGDTIYVTGNQTLTGKIKLSQPQLQAYSKEVVTAGTVQPIPTRFAYIAPPFSGRVVKSCVRLGQHVIAGTPLFEIISPDFTAAQKDYYQARSSRDLSRKDLARKEDLVHNGVSSLKELEEAQTAMLLAEKEYENAQAALYVYQVDPRDMILGQPLVVRSPIAGHVIENNIVTGQYVKDDAEPIATVADLSQVWVTAQVKEKDIRFIREGNEMDIQLSALPGKTIKGIVYHVDEAVDEETRSIKVLSVCDNREGMIKLGMYATVSFLDQPSNCIHIPEKALLQGEKDSYVYVETAPNTYVRKPVEVEVSKGGLAVITKGLNADERIISEGGYYLK